MLAVTCEEYPNDLGILWDEVRRFQAVGRDEDARRVLRKIVATKPANEDQEWYRGRAQAELEGQSQHLLPEPELQDLRVRQPAVLLLRWRRAWSVP